jgi:putative ABC transport system permease protein
MDQLLQDIRFGWRLLLRSPGFTIAAVLALGLDIGATTAVFTLLDRVVLRPLPYQDPDRLTMVWETNDSKSLNHERLSPVNFMDYRGLTQVFDDAAAWWYPQLNLTEAGRDPMRVNAVETSANFFSVIGVQPLVGHGFPASPFFSRDPVVVISHRLWRERFGGDPGVVGRQVTLNGGAFTVTGIMPPDFQYPNDTDVWQRLTWDLTQHSRGAHFMESIARLKPGTTLDQANAELRALTTRLGKEFAGTNGEWRARGVAALALGLAALGIYSVLSYGVNQRRQELSVRMALGAQPRDVLWLVVRQGLTLTALGGLLGAAGAFALGRTLSSLLNGIPAGDVTAFAAAVGLALGTALVACLLPARRAAGLDPLSGLRAD